MSKKIAENDPLDLDKYLEKPKDVKLSTPKGTAEQIHDKDALRRAKVRELKRMGYKEPDEIALVLEGGIKVGNSLVHVDTSLKEIRKDIEFIIQEDMATDGSYAEKRADLLDKLNFLYQRAVTDYTFARGPSKNSFLNTAFTILKEIISMEGVDTPNTQVEDPDIEAIRAAEAVNDLDEEAKTGLITTIEEILKERQDGRRTQEDVVPSEAS